MKIDPALVRKTTAGAIVLSVVVLNAPRVGERPQMEMKAITILRSVHAAQLLYSTSNRGQYSDSLTLATGEPVSSLYGYRFELFTAGDRYAVIAVSQAAVKGRSYCMADDGAIYQTPSGATPAVVSGRCRDTSKPLQ